MDHKVMPIFILLNMLVVNGLTTPEGKFEDRKQYIKFNDPRVQTSLDISTNIQENHGNPVKFTEDITKNDKENIFKDPDIKYTNIIESDNIKTNLVVFEDNKVEQNIANESNNSDKKRRRRRKRKPKQQSVNGHFGFVSQGVPEGQSYIGVERPKRRRRLPQKPSLMEQTSSTFMNALTSISQYDDQQCIPKLLCDTTAGRKGGFSGGSMLQGLLDLQPLMTLLLAYNGATASPLFSFGRAIIIGMSSSNHNPYICHKSYPLCPSDPEKLVHYLNNHNGGFFRFFNNPNNNLNNPNQQQSLNQFLGHLSNAHPGFDQNLFQPQKFPLQPLNQLPYPPNLLNHQQNLRPNHPYQLNNDYGSLQSKNKNFKGYFGKELVDKVFKFKNNAHDVDINETFNKNYEVTGNSLEGYDLDDKKISRRILTKSVEEEEREENNDPIDAFEDIPKWLLQDENKNIQIQPNNNKRKMKTLLFPDEIVISTNNYNYLNIHKPTAEYRPSLNINDVNNKKGFLFPDYNNNNKNQDVHRFKVNKYNQINNKVNVKYENNNSNIVKDSELETVYVVRGNGDPNYPEIVKIRPGTRL